MDLPKNMCKHVVFLCGSCSPCICCSVNQTCCVIPDDNDHGDTSKDLSEARWKLTLPVLHKGKNEIKDIGDLEIPDVYYPAAGGDGVVMRADCDGWTTKGSSYPRCELRELTESGDLASWNIKKGTHIMEYEGSIDNLPTKKPQVVFGQIHDDEDDVIMIRLTKRLLEVVHDTTHYGPLTDEYVLGDVIKITITGVKGGINITSKYKDTTATVRVKKPSSTEKLYFKVGCYTQSNASKGDGKGEYGQVTLLSALTSHSA